MKAKVKFKILEDYSMGILWSYGLSMRLKLENDLFYSHEKVLYNYNSDSGKLSTPEYCTLEECLNNMKAFLKNEEEVKKVALSFLREIIAEKYKDELEHNTHCNLEKDIKLLIRGLKNKIEVEVNE